MKVKGEDTGGVGVIYGVGKLLKHTGDKALISQIYRRMVR